MPHEKIIFPAPVYTEPAQTSQEEARRARETEEQRGVLIQWGVYEVPDNDRGVGVALGRLNQTGDDPAPGDAFMEWMTRSEINWMIRKLRYARDKAFGPNE